MQHSLSVPSKKRKKPQLDVRQSIALITPRRRQRSPKYGSLTCVNSAENNKVWSGPVTDLMQILGEMAGADFFGEIDVSYEG